MKKTTLLFAFLVFDVYAFSQTIPAGDESVLISKEKTVGDYVKFNVQVGAVLNPSFNNVKRESRNSVPDKFSSEKYYEKNTRANAGFSLGLNLLLGKSKIIKHILGVNYLHSRGEYSYSGSHTTISGNYITSSYRKGADYISNIGFLNLMSGIRLRIVKGLSIEPMASINLQLYGVGKVTGYEQSNTLVTYDNTVTHDLPTGKITTISFTPRISYDFYMKEQLLGVYASYNMALGYNLRWCNVGLSWYPFNALR